MAADSYWVIEDFKDGQAYDQIIVIAKCEEEEHADDVVEALNEVGAD